MTEREKISRLFRKDFPDAVPLVEALKLTVHCTPGKRFNGMPVYWLDGTYQLTGYETNQHGEPFTKEMAHARIHKLLAEIKDGRAEVATETREQRFERLVEGLGEIDLRDGYFCSFRHPSGDDATVLYKYGVPLAAWVRFWNEKRAVAEADHATMAGLPGALRTSFANGGVRWTPAQTQNLRREILR